MMQNSSVFFGGVSNPYILGGDYRHSFQGQEKDDEIKDIEGSSINYKYRMYDPRIARFFAVDSKAFNYPFWSPYVFSGNQVIYSHELEGMEPARIIPLSQGGFVAVTKQGGVWAMSSADMKTYMDDRGANPGFYGGSDQASYISNGTPQGSNQLDVTVTGMNPGMNPIHTITIPDNSFLVDDLAVYQNQQQMNIPADLGQDLVTHNPQQDLGSTNPTTDVGTGGADQQNNNNPNNIVQPIQPPAIVIIGNPPPPINVGALWGNFNWQLQNAPAVNANGGPAVNFLRNNPTSTVTITTNVGGSAGSTWNTAAGNGLTYGQIADARNAVLRAALIAQGVNANQIRTQRGSPTAGNNSTIVVTPAGP